MSWTPTLCANMLCAATIDAPDFACQRCWLRVPRPLRQAYYAASDAWTGTAVGLRELHDAQAAVAGWFADNPNGGQS